MKQNPDLKNYEPELTWVSHPALKEPMKAVLALLVALAMAITVTTWAGLWLGGLSFFVVILSVHTFLFPVRYTISPERLTVQSFFGTQRRPWSTVRRADEGKNGVHLSPFSSPNKLDGTRGIYIRFENNRQEVLGAIRKHISRSPNTSSSDPSHGSIEDVLSSNEANEDTRKVEFRLSAFGRIARQTS